MSFAAQAKFLRVPAGTRVPAARGHRVLKANIRVIAATNRDLRKAVEHGDFREDLFYRLKVFDIAIPPLRERAADILPLSEALLQDIGKSFARPPAGLTRDAREALLRYHWPGNVRELSNALERAAILCEGGLIGAEHLALDATGKPRGAVSTDLGTIEHETIAQGPARVPLEQDAGRQASRPRPHAALSPAAEVWARETQGVTSSMATQADSRVPTWTTRSGIVSRRPFPRRGAQRNEILGRPAAAANHPQRRGPRP
jgi:DNA-binding NtrC family response regulator